MLCKEKEEVVSPLSSWRAKFIVFIGASFFILCSFVTWRTLRESFFPQETLMIIDASDTVWMMKGKMEKAGVQDSWLFMLIGGLFKQAFPFRPGEYSFTQEDSLLRVLFMLHLGDTVLRRITIPEGWTVAQIVDFLKNTQSLKGKIGDVPDEGTLLPETYQYDYGFSRQKLLNRMKKLMDKALKEEWNSASNPPLTSQREVLILASIIEKETALGSERALISGVFHNRLRIHMPLQSDPTVIYAITQGKEKLKRTLTYRDLRYDSPYNTYVYKELPPGPIACPGRQSIRAALRPEKTRALYFVANGQGGHTFSETFKEHGTHVKKWRQLNRKS